MRKVFFNLESNIHWNMKPRKVGGHKLKIRGKVKKWLKRNCSHYVILRDTWPPCVMFSDEEEAMLFKLTWL